MYKIDRRGVQKSFTRTDPPKIIYLLADKKRVLYGLLTWGLLSKLSIILNPVQITKSVKYQII